MISGPPEPQAVETQTAHSSPPSTHHDTGALDDVDLIWGDSNDAPNREWSKMDEDFTNAGYREGITAGKESALQEGFDEGFALVGAPLGRAIGLLRGAANAAVGFISSRASDTDPDALEQRKNEVRSIIGSLGRINLEDLAPQDIQAEEHAKEHLDYGTSSDVQTSFKVDAHHVDVSKSENNQIESKPAFEELDQLRTRLSNVLREIGLDILITN